MVIIVVQGGDTSFQEVFLAAVVVFEPDKSVIITEQLFQFVRSAASVVVRIPAILGISTFTGMKNYDFQLLASFRSNVKGIIFL